MNAFTDKKGRPKLSTTTCWVCGELRDWHFDPDEHPFVGTVVEDGVFREWYKRNRAKHVFFLDWVRSMLGLSSMPDTNGLRNERACEFTGLNGVCEHSFQESGRTPRRGSNV